MSRNRLILLLALTVGLVAQLALAQEHPFSSPLSPQQTMAKEKAVEEHHEKRLACKKRAKEAGLGYLDRKKFVSDCMAAK